MTPDWCREETIAALIDLPPTTFREYVANGWLPKGVKIGKHRLWNRERVSAALAKLEEPSLNDGAVMKAVRGMGDHGKKKDARRDAA
jgi:hypothetical protein